MLCLRIVYHYTVHTARKYVFTYLLIAHLALPSVTTLILCLYIEILGLYWFMLVLQVLELRDRRDALLRERGEIDRNAAVLKDKFKRLESELFRRLHDESGREYDPSLFSLLQTDDGGLFIVPRNNTDSERTSASDKSHDEKSGRKRKSKRKD